MLLYLHRNRNSTSSHERKPLKCFETEHIRQRRINPICAMHKKQCVHFNMALFTPKVSIPIGIICL